MLTLSDLTLDTFSCETNKSFPHSKAAPPLKKRRDDNIEMTIVWAGVSEAEAGARVMRHLCPTNHPNVRHISAEIRHTGPARPITAGP